VKRGSSEGRWADVPSARIRFAAEAVFLLLVAAGAALAELSALWIILLMFAAWVLVALIERSISRGAPAAIAEEAAEREVEIPPEPKPREAYRWLRWRRARAAIEPLTAPTAPLEERPSRSHVRRIEPEAPPAELPAALEVVEPEPATPGPAVTRRPLDLPGLERPEPEPEPVRAAAPPPEEPPTPLPTPPPPPEPPAYQPPPAPRPPAREWNLWDLERRARELAGDALRDEEWTALFVHLREFANADGVLPKEFDDLVRESFAELIQAA